MKTIFFFFQKSGKENKEPRKESKKRIPTLLDKEITEFHTKKMKFNEVSAAKSSNKTSMIIKEEKDEVNKIVLNQIKMLKDDCLATSSQLLLAGDSLKTIATVS